METIDLTYLFCGETNVLKPNLSCGNHIMNDSMSKQPSITIKKYANRRLYNTATSTYVTLEDLSQMVKEGLEFNVYDAKTSEDITRSVLTQIIVEEEGKSGQQNLLPISFLRQLIGFYGDSLQWMVPKYLEHSMQSLTGNQDQIRNYFQTTFGNLFPFGTTLEEMSKQNFAMFERTMRLFTPFNLESLTESVMPGLTTNQQNQTSCATCAPKGQNANQPSTQNTQTNEPKTQACSMGSGKTQESPSMASVTNLKSRLEQTPQTSAASLVQTSSTPSMPMPSVQAASAISSGADDMQQKIANLQRQLADLAKSRA